MPKVATCPSHPGRKAVAKGLCTLCYQRERRGSTRTNERQPDGVMLAPLKVDPREDMLIRAAAELEGVTVAAWLRHAIRVRLMQAALAQPKLRELGNEVLAVINVSAGP